jgi:outer membrane protein assembly factor BamB
VMTPVAGGGVILGFTKRLVCLDAKDLSTLWTSTSEPIFKRECHLIVSQDMALAFSNRGELRLFSFDRTGVKVLGRSDLCGQTWMHPTVVGPRLYVRDSEFLYCHSLGEGK